MADQTLAKHVNELSILTMLRTQSPASRADIARRLAVTPATITRLVAALIERELVQEVRGPGQTATTRDVGRPGVGIALNPHGAYLLGVEIGVGVLRYAVLDLAASVVASSETPAPKAITPAAAIQAIAGQVATLQDDARFRGRIRSVGVTVPGLVTSEGFIIYLPILGWTNVDLGALLGEAIGLPCLVENNADAAAFGAVYTQPSLPRICTIFLKLGTGCGGAAIINGRLLRGATGTAGELGHIRLTERGRRCSCGQTGCLESWVNLAALAHSFRGTDDLDDAAFAALPADVVNAAAAGDGAALAAIETLSHYLTLGIVTLVNIFNPTTIMLGGVMRPVLEHCLEALQAGVIAGIVPGTRAPDVRLSQLGTLECAIGAASIAHHHTFDLSIVDLSEPTLRP